MSDDLKRCTCGQHWGLPKEGAPPGMVFVKCPHCREVEAGGRDAVRLIAETWVVGGLFSQPKAEVKTLLVRAAACGMGEE